MDDQDAAGRIEHPCRECILQEERTIFKYLKRITSYILHRKHKWKIIIAVTILGVLTFGYFKITQEPVPEYITAKVVRGDLVQTVEAVGTVTSERDLKLQFPVSGVVGEVLVKEGDHVEAGDRLASLRGDNVQAYVNSAYANVQAEQAKLQELKEGTRMEDIIIAEAEVANKRATLEASREQLKSSESELLLLEREAEINLAGEVGKARSTVSQQMTKSRNALAVLDDVMADNDVSDALTRSEPQLPLLVLAERDSAVAVSEKLFREGIDFDNYEDALRVLRLTRSGVVDASHAIERLYLAITTVPPTGAFTRSEREDRKTDLNTEKNNLQSSLASIDAAIKSLQDASATYDTKIASEQTAITRLRGDILTYESSLRTQEAQLALKKAGSRQTDIDAASARVRQAQADLARAKADFAETVLFAPTTGSITRVNIKTGELLSTAFQQDAAITMLGDSPYHIELYASEIDIPKVQVNMEAKAELDAFPGKPFSLIVAEVDPAATDVDGVPKYRIKLDFTVPPERLKIGMTGDTDIFTGKREDVISVPARAVVENDAGEEIVRILKKKDEIEERKVITGLEGENDIEILEGLQEGEEVVVLIKK